MSLSFLETETLALNAGKSLSKVSISDQELKDIYNCSLICVSVCETIGETVHLATRYFREISENMKTFAGGRKIPYDDRYSFGVTPEKAVELVSCYIAGNKRPSDNDLFHLYECFLICNSFFRGIGRTVTLVSKYFVGIENNITNEIHHRGLYAFLCDKIRDKT